MPLYEYICIKCSNLAEYIQKVDEPAPDTCEHCGAENSLEKQIGLSSFQLVGDGWYKDLYSSPKQKRDNKCDT